MSVAFLFPGQGSQVKGMGADSFNRFPHLVQQANTELGYALDEICLKDEENQLGQTQFTQPALYLASYLDAQSKIEDGTTPVLAAGHSVGEFAALATAGAFSFIDGLKMVSKRGEIMAKLGEEEWLRSLGWMRKPFDPHLRLFRQTKWMWQTIIHCWGAADFSMTLIID